MGASNEMDFGGLTLVVNDIKSGATAAGQAGTASASVDVKLTGNQTVAGVKTFSDHITIGAGKTIDLDSAAASLSSHAATLTKWAGVITTEALTTAAGASQAFVLTLTGVAAGDLAFVTRCGGTNTNKSYNYDAVTTTNTVTVTVYNNHASGALDGTLKFNLWVLKA